ncbi:MAG: VOC family protein [Myxococcaceae bacterium]
MPNVNPIPSGYRTVTPFLNATNAPKLIDCMKQAFQAKELYKMSEPDGKVRHAELEIGDSKVMVASHEPAMPTSLYLYVSDCDGWFRRAVAAGGKSVREPTTEFYGDRTCAVKDSEGNVWWLATHVEDVSPEELKRRAAGNKQVA